VCESTLAQTGTGRTRPEKENEKRPKVKSNLLTSSKPINLAADRIGGGRSGSATKGKDTVSGGEAGPY